MNKRIIIIAVSFVSILGFGIYAMNYLSKQKELPEEKEKEQKETFVKIATVELEAQPVHIKSYGRVASAQPINLIAEANGRLEKGAVSFKKGTNFHKGQLICKIVDREKDLNLLSRKSEFLNAIAKILPDIKIDYNDRFEDWKSYFEQLDIKKPLPDLPEYKSLKEKTFLASRNILRDYYSILGIEQALLKQNIYAPYNGSITDIKLEVGSVVRMGSEIGKIIKTENYEIEIPVNVKEIKWLSINDKVNITTDDGIQSWTGKVIRIGDRVDPQHQSVNVYIKINSLEKQKIYDGMYLEANVRGANIPDTYIVPRKLLFEKNKIYILESDSILRVKEVKVLHINEEEMIIGGLVNGNQVVIESPSYVRENMIVKVLK